MLKDRQGILVLGELVLFLAAWGLGIAAAVDDNRVRTNAKARNNVAAKTNSTEVSSSRIDFIGIDFIGVDPAGVRSSGEDLLGASHSNPRDSIRGESSLGYTNSMISQAH